MSLSINAEGADFFIPAAAESQAPLDHVAVDSVLLSKTQPTLASPKTESAEEAAPSAAAGLDTANRKMFATDEGSRHGAAQTIVEGFERAKSRILHAKKQISSAGTAHKAAEPHVGAWEA